MHSKYDKLPLVLSLVVFGYLAWPSLSGRPARREEDGKSVPMAKVVEMRPDGAAPSRDPFADLMNPDRYTLRAAEKGVGILPTIDVPVEAAGQPVSYAYAFPYLTGTMILNNRSCVLIDGDVYLEGESVDAGVDVRIDRIVNGKALLELPDGWKTLYMRGEGEVGDES